MAEKHAPEQERAVPERPRVLVFFDYACPFCYVDQNRFDVLDEELEFDTVLVPFELRPTLPEEGIDLDETGSGHSERVDEYLKRIAEKEGFRFVQPGLLPNTHKALVLGEIARDAGDSIHEEVHRAIFSAYFAEERDIGSREVLLDIAEGVGIESDHVRRAWDEGIYDERLDSFRHVALHLGLDATPAALICNELFVGSRPMGVLRDALERCGSHAEAGDADTIENDTRAQPAELADDQNGTHTTSAEGVES